jgi:hypothetical protein
MKALCLIYFYNQIILMIFVRQVLPVIQDQYCQG